MKCPYRKITERIDSGDGFDTHEYFAECYKEECPCYVPENIFSGGIMTTEYCLRVSKESKE